jgi:TRAP-type C4-dicarboxylate transport system permease small subunit
MKEKIENILGSIFGLMFLFLVVLVSVETIGRKVFNFSIQGADELGGYALAIGSTLSFSLALLGRNHIRVDVLHEKFGPRLQAFMNWLSIVSLAAFAIFMAWVAQKVIMDTMAYGSTAQTPWATPLVYPQGIWLAGLAVFALVAFAFAVRATTLLLRGQIAELNEDYQPKSAKEELQEELADIALRSQDSGVKP